MNVQRDTRAQGAAGFAAVTLLLALLALLLAPSAAHAVQATSTKLTVAPAGAAMNATYTFSGFRVKNETVTRYSVTFPVGTNVAGAQGANPGDTVIISGRTVTVVLATPIVGGGGGGVAASFAFKNIGNPIAAGNYSIPSITFVTNGANQTINLGRSGNYTILQSPYLALTITTPDAPQSVLFGTVDPGITTSANVLVEIDASNAWTMTRTITGSVAALGFQITSPAPINVLTAGGYYAYDEAYSVNPPWTTTPSVAYTAQVVYTVTMQ